MSVNLSNILNGGVLPAAAGGTGLTSSGNTGNFLMSTGTGWTSSAIPSTVTKTITNKTGAYTVVAADLDKIINCTSGTFTISLTAAATLAAGFNITIWNTSTTSTDVITIDPNASETIDGLSTLTLYRGTGLQIVCDGTNWQTGSQKELRAYSENVSVSGVNKPISSGDGSVSVGGNAQSTGAAAYSFGAGSIAAGAYSLAMGLNSQANGARSIAIGNNTVVAGSDYSTAIGNNSGFGGSVTATGVGAMALGGSYASGTNSFAAAIADNTNSYGATGSFSVAIGRSALASGTYSIAINGYSTASASYSMALNSGTASGANAVAFGNSCVASGNYAYAFGNASKAAQIGKYAYSSGVFGVSGDAQYGKIVLRGTTSDATPKVITSDAATAGTTNQVVLPNSGVFTFSILVTAVRTVGEAAGWKFEGVILRTGTASGTSIVDYTKTVLGKTTSSWDCNISADTTNGALAVTVTGAASATYWVAVVDTAEVIGV